MFLRLLPARKNSGFNGLLEDWEAFRLFLGSQPFRTRSESVIFATIFVALFSFDSFAREGMREIRKLSLFALLAEPDLSALC